MFGTSAFALKVMPPDDEPTFRRQVLGAHDTDHDGRLSDAEFKAMQAARKQGKVARRTAMLQRYDLDKNGKLSDAERGRRVADGQARLLPEFDANRNGVIDKTERQAILVKRMQTQTNNKYTLMVLRFDANRDGVLQISELPGKAGKAGKAQKRFRGIDSNRDGSIDRAEFRAHAVKAVKAAKAKHAKKAKKAKQTKQAKLAGKVKQKGHKL